MNVSMENISTMVEWEVTMVCNYKCNYCTNLNPSLRPVLCEEKIEAFITMLGETYPGVEVFIFGGEPFLHKKIDYIISTFNRLNIPFVIQTNLSNSSQEILNNIDEPFTLQVSIHPTQIAIEDIHIPKDLDIRVIDVMYTGKSAVDYYLKIKERHENVYLTPITDFGDGISNHALKEFNRMRKNPMWRKIINFEEVKRLGKNRSELWESYSPRDKPCLYAGKYFLYAPNMTLYNCCHRVNHNGICSHDKCFLM